MEEVTLIVGRIGGKVVVNTFTIYSGRYYDCRDFVWGIVEKNWTT